MMMQKMRVAHVTSALGQEGAGVRTVVEALSAQQVQAGHEVRVFGLDSPGWQAGDREAWQGAPSRVFSAVGPQALGYAPGMEGAITGFAPDIIHLHGLWKWPSVAALRASRRLGVKRVVSPHGMLDAWALSQSRLKKRAAMSLFERSNLNGAVVHALCEAELQSIRSLGLKTQVVMIPNGVTSPFAEHAPELAPPWADRLPRSAKVLLFLGRIHPKKGLPVLIEAMQACQEKLERGEWHLVVAGWDQAGHQAELEESLSAGDLSQRVHFVGPVFGAAKAAALAQADIFILPSFSEGLPMSVLEAWESGLPVLMTPYCNLSEGEEAGAAWIAEPEPKALAQQLGLMLSLTQKEREQAGQKGAQLVAEQFTWDVVEESFCDLYGWLSRGGESTVSPPGFVVKL